MARFDSTGREISATSWDAIQDIPEIVDELANLPDPGFDGWFWWDDSIDEIVIIEPDADHVNYDNSSSGYSATNVQDAIDEIATLQTTFAGYVKGSLGASVVGYFNPVASAWTVSQTTNPGLFRVTHNEGLTNPEQEMSVTATARISAGGTNDRYANVTNETANYFEVTVVDGGSGNVNEDFYFHAIRLS